MKKEEREQIYQEAWTKYGPKMQMTVAIEEMSELQKEICKMLRNNSMEANAPLAEEIADVYIMLEQLIFFFTLDKWVSVYMNAKIDRLRRRMQGGE